ncbi:MAG: ABC transporter ATP-binding protein [Rhodospirillales bacterium]|nr:ABC transporter ATP-binding protein [Rhodospirillales bacterium]MDP6642762.1 ABC transporter ATP-binding protein [Rhodospirillales bacterium]
MLLELINLSKAFGSVVVAENVNLSVGKGAAIGIIGPNGAGKSSLFNLITGELAPDAGTIHLDGHDITNYSPEARCIAGIGRSYQIPQPFETLTVFENLMVGAVYGNGQTEAQASRSCGEVLERTGLLAKANRVAGTLSLLERKRLEMARALATQPRIILLDEIAGGLTETECDELVGAIADIHAAGITIIWIEHVVHALLAAVEHLIVLNFGSLIVEGEPNAVMESRDVQEIYMGLTD